MRDTGDIDVVRSREQLAVMVTRRCNMTCAHCSVESGPKTAGGDPAEAEVLDWVRQAADAGVRVVRLTGGEPMMRGAVVRRLLQECRRLGIRTTMNTNGFWGRTAQKARRTLGSLRRAGLDSLIVSYDRYHADFQGPAPVRHIAAAARSLDVPLSVTMVRSAADPPDLIAVLNDAGRETGARVRVYDLQPVGRGRGLLGESDAGDVEGFCTACGFAAVADDGRVMACNGPAYFEPAASPLVLGSLRGARLDALLDRHESDPILDTIRTEGPAGLREALKTIPGFGPRTFRPTYRGMCELCHDITRDEAAVAALRTHLARPDLVAKRRAAWQVIVGNRRQGALSGTFVNGPGAARVFLDAAWRPEAPFDDDAARILGSAHLDWRQLAAYLCGAGLARPLAPAMTSPEIARWAPPFFRDAMRQRAVADGLRELVQRDAIGRIAEALGDMGGRGVLLKGTAMAVHTPPSRVPRATSDIDVLVGRELGPRLRERLLARGFDGRPGAGQDTWHHLEAISWQGVPVEIHTRVMAGLWGLPEREMLRDRRPTPDWPALDTFAPAALVLHDVVHAAASFYAFGLKTAWDLRVILDGAPDVDWDTVARWANALAAPRAFWVPMRVLVEALELDVPRALLRMAPADAGGRRAEELARRRLFRATERFVDLDVLSKAGMMLLLHHNLRGRARYLAAKLWWRGAHPATWGQAVGRARRADLLRQAWRNYRKFRKVVG